ncbi:MAG TPA: alpha/beta fold hydrolase [Terriglobia bacterium]|jgi:pimeloyl-ACP methyl ester carboxylesterase
MRTDALEPRRETGTLPTQPPTPYFRYFSGAQAAPRVLVVHGLNSNKAFMQIFCAALADAGFEAYAIDLPGHGDSNVGFNAVLADRVLDQAVSLLNPDIAIGHSMGASLLIDLAHHAKFRKLVLISPGTTAVNDLKFENTLVTSETWDIPAVNAFAPHLDGAEWRKFTWGMHSSALMKPDQIREIVKWLGGDPDKLRTGRRLAWLGLMFAAASTLGIVLLPKRPAIAQTLPFSKADVVLCYVVAGGAAVVVQKYVVVLRFVRLFAMDYLVSFFFVAGVVLVAILTAKKQLPSGDPKAIVKAIMASAFVIVLLGLIAGSHFIHMSLSDGRWWRFLVISAASFPLYLFDETITREIGARWRNAGIAVVTRTLIAASIATGVLLLNRQSAFIVLLLGLFLVFWLTLWIATGLVGRHVRNPVAAALFAALVQGWMFAAWFVTV